MIRSKLLIRNLITQHSLLITMWVKLNSKISTTDVAMEIIINSSSKVYAMASLCQFY